MKTLVIGEILARFSNQQNDVYGENKDIKMNFGGAEYNVACNLSYWGESVSFISKIKPNWFIQKGLDHLKSYGVNTNLILKDDKEFKNGFYILETGLSNKTPRVIYDRSETAFCHFSELDALKKAIDLNDQVFVCGISLAVNIITKQTIIEGLKYANSKKKTIIFDFNYRQSLWDYNNARNAFESILPFVDIALCGWKDIDYILGLRKFNEENDYDSELIESYKTLMIKYPNLKIVTSTKRKIVSTFSQQITGYLFDGKNLVKSDEFTIDSIVDRIGTGDAFAAGIIYSLYNKVDLNKAIEFATKANVLKHSYYGDNQKLGLDLIDKLKSKIEDISR